MLLKDKRNLLRSNRGSSETWDRRQQDECSVNYWRTPKAVGLCVEPRAAGVAECTVCTVCTAVRRAGPVVRLAECGVSQWPAPGTTPLQQPTLPLQCRAAGPQSPVTQLLQKQQRQERRRFVTSFCSPCSRESCARVILQECSPHLSPPAAGSESLQ